MLCYDMISLLTEHLPSFALRNIRFAFGSASLSSLRFRLPNPVHFVSKKDMTCLCTYLYRRSLSLTASP